jgi:nitrogen fixation protein NifU and related proteins
MSDSLYRKELLRLAADAHGAGRLSAPHATGQAVNSTCGDRVTIDLSVKDGRIVSIAQETKACVLTQASASILAQKLTGARREDVESLRATVQTMLEETGGAPLPPYDAFGAFDAAAAYPNRHCCVLLPFEAVLAAFDASEAGEPEAVGRKA